VCRWQRLKALIEIMCAVCAEANDDLVLAANVVDSLMQRQSQIGLVEVEPRAVAVSPYGWLMTHYGWLAG